MKRQLSTAEVEQVDQWIRQRGFTYEDVRVEILDHVVCAMEDIMNQTPQLTLMEAFKQVHAGFGIFGFSTIEETFTKMVENRSRRALLNHLLSMLKPTGLPLTLSLMLLLVVLQQLGGENMLFALPMLTTLFFLIKRWQIYRKEKKLREYLAFRVALSYTFFTMPASFYFLTFLPKIENTATMIVLGIIYAFILCSLEWSQWQVLQAELDKHRQLRQKIGLA